MRSSWTGPKAEMRTFSEGKFPAFRLWKLERLKLFFKLFTTPLQIRDNSAPEAL